jgi:hypothetical protein
MIPTSVSVELLDLQTQVAQASPLDQASGATIKALQLNAGNLVEDIQAALVATSILDGWVAPTDPASMATGFATVAEAGSDQQALSLMRGIVGRVASNLDQLV